MFADWPVLIDRPWPPAFVDNTSSFTGVLYVAAGDDYTSSDPDLKIGNTTAELTSLTFTGSSCR
jgi:hypothetical protein